MRRSLLFIGLLALVLAPSAYAAPADLCAWLPPGTCSGSVGVTLLNVMKNTATFLLSIVSAAAMIFVVWGGLNMAASLGDDSRYSGGKSSIYSALIGIAVALMSQVILVAISTPFQGNPTFGVLIQNIVFSLIDLLRLAFFIALAVTAFRFVAAYGRSDEIEKARNALLYAAIGAIVVNIAEYILSAVINLVLPSWSFIKTLAVPKAYAAGDPFLKELCQIFHPNCGSGALPSQIGLSIAAFIAQFVWLTCAIIIIIGAFRIASSGTSDDGRNQGKQMIITAGIGFFLALAADAILAFANTTFVV